MLTKFVVEAPKGKLGIHFADRENGHGTAISMIARSSPLSSEVMKGDRILKINGTDVHKTNKSGRNIISKL